MGDIIDFEKVRAAKHSKELFDKNNNETLTFLVNELIRLQRKSATLKCKGFAFFKNIRLKKMYRYELDLRIGILTYYYLVTHVYTNFDKALSVAKLNVYKEDLENVI